MRSGRLDGLTRWVVTFHTLLVELLAFDTGEWSLIVNGEETVTRKTQADCIAEIERELLEIRAAIPEPKPIGGPRHCLEHGGYGFTSDCLACAAAIPATREETP